MLDFDLRLLRSFVALAEERSFTRAAVHLHMTQPALSLQIQKLEAQLGIPLFRRSTRAVELTTEAIRLLPYAQRLVDQSLDLQSMLRHLQRGGAHKFHIGAAAYTADIAARNAIMDEFIARSDENSVAVHSARQNELIADVERQKLDVAFILGMGVPREKYDALAGAHKPGEGIYPLDLHSFVVARRDVEVLLPAESPLSRNNSIAPADLRGQQLAMVACSEGRPLFQPILQMFEAAGVTIVFPPEAHVPASVERYGSLKRIAALSLGWAEMASAREAQERGMVRCAIAGCSSTTDLVVVSSPKSRKPMVDAFFDLAREIATASAHRQVA